MPVVRRGWVECTIVMYSLNKFHHDISLRRSIEKRCLQSFMPFLLWHEAWRGGKVRLACDNSSGVDAINKHTIKGPAIVPLQRIFLIAAIYHIQIPPFWISSDENIMADAASRILQSPSTITIAPEAAFILHNSLPPSTRRRYGKILRTYESFCQ